MKTLYESILSSTNSGKDAYYINVIKKNLEMCDDIKEFTKAWSALDLDINDSHWDELGGEKSYVCVRGKSRPSYLVYCKNGMIVIYNDEPELWKSDKEFTDYCNKAANTLKMKKRLSKTQRGNECILEF